MSLRPRVTFTAYRGHAVEVGPASEPVTAAGLRAYLVETETSLPDADANALIAEARNLIEEKTGLAFISQSWRMALDAWPSGSGPWWDGVRQGAIADVIGAPGFVYLPRYPLASIASVTVYDEAGSATAVDVAATFDTDTYQRPGRMALKSGATWPIALRSTNAIEIVYEAGYANAAAVPPIMARAVKQVAAYLYAHKGDDCDMGDALAGVKSLLSAYVVARL
jgi:hypothetical protein